MNVRRNGRHDVLTAVGFVAGFFGSVVLIVGELANGQTLVLVGLIILILGLVLTLVGAVIESRVSGRSFARSLASGARAVFRFVLDFF